jgi:hypothetical protein
MVLTTAACGHTSTFDWDNNRLVLPPQDTFGFVIEHYTEFDQLTVPMWMWLSICIQAVMEEEIPPPGSMPGNFENVFLDVSKSNTYNTVAERNKILAWFQQHLIPDGLWHSVDHGPFTYHNRYIPVSLATFLAVIKQGRSFDNSSHWIKNTPRSFLDNVLLDLKHHSAPPQSLQSLADTISHNSLLPTHHSSSPSRPTSLSTTQRLLSASVETAHSLQTLPELVVDSALPSGQNDSVDGGSQGIFPHGPPSAHSIQESASDD